MPRNMSFMLTVEQVRNKTKTVTRRQGWWFLKEGDILNAVEKGMGLKKGEKVKKICQIRVTNISDEFISSITEGDLIKEGFPDLSKSEFIHMYCTHNRIDKEEICNRIEFEYVRECEECGHHLTDDYFIDSETLCYMCTPMTKDDWRELGYTIGN